MEELKKEFRRITTEIQKFDINMHLSPGAKQRLKEFERRYNQLIVSINKAQKQFDREFNRAVRNFKKTRADAERHINVVRQTAKTQQQKLYKVTEEIKKKVATRSTQKISRKKATSTKKTGRKKTVRKTASKK